MESKRTMYRLFLDVFIVFIVVMVGYVARDMTINTARIETKKWCTSENEHKYIANYDRYKELVTFIGDVSVGVDVADVQEGVSFIPKKFKGILKGKSIEQINKMISDEDINRPVNNGSVEENMNALFNGDDANNYVYKTRIVSGNYYYPDVYVYKLINDNGNSIIVTLYVDYTGGVINVRASN